MDKKEVIVLDFNCEDDLTKYTDSMLFDSGEVIASGVFACRDRKLEIDLRIVGEVSVTYKEDVYHRPSEFPDELKELIRKYPNEWDWNLPYSQSDDIYVGLNNWFEYIYDVDGDIMEDDLSKMTKEDVLKDMIEIARIYFERECEPTEQHFFAVKDCGDASCTYGLLEVTSNESLADIEKQFYDVRDAVREENDEWQIKDILVKLPGEWHAKYHALGDLYI